MARGASISRPIVMRIGKPGDPVDESLLEDRERQADNLSDALEGLAAYTDDDTKFMVYKIEGAGSWAFVERAPTPFNSEELIERLKIENGGGSYCVRVYVDGKIKTTKHFSIATQKAAPGADPAGAAAGGLTTKDLIAMLLSQGKDGKTDLAMMMQMQQQQSERTMQMMMTMMGQSQQSQATMISALLGGRDKLSEVAAVMAPMLNKPGSGFGEFAEVIKLARELLPPPAAAVAEDDSFAGLALKAVTPHLGDFARGFVDLAATRRADGATSVAVQPVDYTRTPPATPHRLPAGTGRFPVLAELAGDVLFYFGRRMDPDIAADGLVDVLTSEALKAKGFTEADIVPLLATLQSAGPQWLDELALEGIDLRADPVWATGFLNALIAVYRGEDGSSERPGGGAGNAADDGKPRAVGVATDASAKPGAGDHERAPA